MSIYYVPTKQLTKKIIEENSSINDKNKWKVDYYLAFLESNLHSKCFLAYNNINICAYVS